MEFKRLNEITHLQEADESTWWEALKDLTPSLDEVLVVDQSLTLAENDLPQALTVFQARDPQSTELYALVTRLGKVVVGRTDDLKRRDFLSLGEHDALWHSIVSLNVTRRFRPVGDRLDIWIVCRFFQQDQETDPETVVYHGLVWVDNEGQPHLQAALDDIESRSRSTERWRAQPSYRLDSWMMRDGFSILNRVEDCPDWSPEDLSASPDESSTSDDATVRIGPVELSVCGQKLLCLASCDRLVLVRKKRLELASKYLSMRDKVRCLAFTEERSEGITSEEDQNHTAGPIGIVGCDDRRLVAFHLDNNGELVTTWHQTLDDFPVTLAFVNNQSHHSYPSILVGFSHGRLGLLRYVGNGIRRQWEKCWTALGLEKAEARFRILQQTPDIEHNRLRALWVGVLRGILDEAPRTDPNILQEWLNALPLLFPTRRKEAMVPEAFKILVDRLRFSALESEPLRPLGSGQGDFLPALVLAIYEQRLDITERELIDETVRAFVSDLDKSKDPALRRLTELAHRTPASICQEATPDNASERTKRIVFELQRWTHVFLPSDTIGFRRKEPSKGLVGVLGVRTTSGTRLAIAHHDQVAFHPITENGLCIKTPENTYRPESSNLRSLLAVPIGDRDLVLAIGTYGHFHLLDPENQNELWLGNLIFELPADSWVAAACPRDGDTAFVAMIINQHKRSLFVSCVVSKTQVTIGSQVPLGLPEVSAVDIVQTETGYRLMVGLTHPGPTRVLQLDREGKAQEGRWLRTLESEALAVRLCTRDGKCFAVSGEQNGMVCCTDLATDSSYPPLRWTYRMDGAVRGLGRVLLQDEPHLLVGAESGELCLFRARDGKRAWKQRLDDPIRQVDALPPPVSLALAVTRGEMLTIFEQVTDPEDAYTKALEQIQSLDNPPTATPAAECALAFYQLLREGRDFLEVLQAHQGRETRTRLLRYLVQKAEVLTLDQKAIVTELDTRELTLLMSYLPDALTRWDESIALILSQRSWGESLRERRASEAAVVTSLRRLGLQNPSVELLIRQQPNNEAFQSSWVRLVFTRLLVEATTRETTDLNDATLFQDLLEYLLRLPNPDLIASLAQVFPYDSPLQQDIRAFDDILSRIAERAPLPQLSLVHVVHRLRMSKRRSHVGDWLYLLKAFLTMLMQINKTIDTETLDNDVINWNIGRKEIIQSLQALSDACPSEFQIHSTPQWVATVIRNDLLLRTPVLADSEPLKDRIRVIEAALTHLKIINDTHHIDTSNSDLWHAFHEGLIEAARDAIHSILDQEYDYLLNLVRPRIVLDYQYLDEDGHLYLRLEVQGEGRRELNDVSIQIDASGPEGLKEPGKIGLEEALGYISYPGRFPKTHVQLDGYIRPGQREVVVRTRMEDEEGHVVAESWWIPIHTVSLDGNTSFTLPNILKVSYQEFFDRIKNTQAPITLAVLDPSLGEERFILDWENHAPGHRVDLDKALEDTGRGRRYSQRALDVSLIDNTITEIAAHRHLSGEKELAPLVIAPCNATIQRLLMGEAPGVLEAWLGQLREWQAAQGRRVLVVSSRHASQLRAIGLGDIPEVIAHLLPASSLIHISNRGKSRWEEAISLIEERAKTSADFSSDILETLGGDLRLLIRWLSLVREESKPIAIKEFLSQEENQRLLLQELRSLGAYDLVCVLVGANTITQLNRHQVSPGQFAAENFYSTTRSRTARKLIQREGSPFTPESLDRISSDLYPPATLEVEGFGLSGHTTVKQTRLLTVTRHRQNERLKNSFERLEQQGFGQLINGIFRTGSPYRELVAQLYERADEEPMELRDGLVYRTIMGDNRSLADVIAPTELSELSNQALSGLFAGIEEPVIKAIRRVARLWNEQAGDDEILRALQEVFGAQKTKRLLTTPERWDRSMFEISLACFGVFENKKIWDKTTPAEYPDTYILWVPRDTLVDIRRISQAVETSRIRRNATERKAQEILNRRLKVILLGPGADELTLDNTRQVAVLRLADIYQAAWEGDLVEGLHRKAKAQLRLSAYSPFQTSGALPPGSPLFRGRDRELGFIRTKIREASILIVGGRRMGKTSLLNHVYHWALQQQDVEPLYLDLQGIHHSAEFVCALTGLATNTNLQESTRQYLKVCKKDEEPRTLLHGLANSIQTEGRMPIFLLNEVDGLFEHDLPLVEAWRGMNDIGKARFLMVGYSVINRMSTLGAPDSPFFNFTVGTDFGGKAISLGALSDPAAKELLDLLERGGLGLRWVSEAKKQTAYQELLQRSFCIPWVLQRYGQLLVENLESSRHDRIDYEDVAKMLKVEGGVVWQYIQAIDYSSLGYDKGTQDRVGFDIVLYTIARNRYFLGEAKVPIQDPRLRERNALDEELGFSVGDAKKIVTETLKELLFPKELQAFQQWFNALPLDQALRQLTLTLALEPDPEQHNRYGFLLHIVPLELYDRYGQADPTLDGLIAEKAAGLLNLVEYSQKV